MSDKANEFREGDRVRHRSQDVEGRVKSTSYPAPKFLVEWDDDTWGTLESFHTVEKVGEDNE